MNYNGIIGDIQLLGSKGILSQTGFDYNQLEKVCNDCNETEVRQVMKSYDNAFNASNQVAGFFDIVGSVLSQVLTTITGGGSQQVQCPQCQPIPQKGIQDYLMPALIGFGLGYLILK